MKRLFPILALALFLIILVLPVSATENEPVIPEGGLDVTVTDNPAVPDDGSACNRIFKVTEPIKWNEKFPYGYQMGLGIYWDDSGFVYLDDDRAGLYYICDQSYNPVSADSWIDNDLYFLKRPNIEFTIVSFDSESGPSSEVYEFSAEIPPYPFYFMAYQRIKFEHSSLGTCMFGFSKHRDIVFLTGVSADGSYKNMYLLMSSDGNEKKIRPQDFLESGLYYAVDLCYFGDHDYSEWMTVKKPTCISTGIKSRTCSLCGYVETEVIAESLDHTYTEVEVIKEATCTEAGLELRTCQICGLESEFDVEALGHDFPIFGSCRREGCDAYTGQNIVDGAVDAWQGITDKFGGNSSPDDKKSGVDGILMILGLGLGFLLLLLLWPLLKVLVDLIVTVVKAISSGIKKLRKRSKTKSKK